MKTIHFVRHQAAGILWEYPFAKAPTAEQVEALGRLCFQRHGENHPKSGESYWLTPIEINVLGSDEVPSVPERSLSVVSEAGVPQFSVSAKGTVTPPKEG
jgi:hypothetical protein